MSSMRNEVFLEHLRDGHGTHQVAVEALHHSEKTNRILEFQAIKTNISPISYDNKLNWIHGRVWQGTGTWLLEDKVFKNWLDVVVDEKERILWLHGIPGCGQCMNTSLLFEYARLTNNGG